MLEMIYWAGGIALGLVLIVAYLAAEAPRSPSKYLGRDGE